MSCQFYVDRGSKGWIMPFNKEINREFQERVHPFPEEKADLLWPRRLNQTIESVANNIGFHLLPGHIFNGIMPGGLGLLLCRVASILPD
jgi:hypothetical protein